MNAIEQIIKKKLSTALNEKKKEIALNIFEVIQPVAISPITPKPAKPQKGEPLIPAANPAGLANKKQGKMNQINALNAKISALQGTSSSAKDPGALNQKLQQYRQRLGVMKQELATIKEDDLKEFYTSDQRKFNKDHAVAYGKAAGKAAELTKKANAASELANKTNLKRHHKTAESLHDKAEMAHIDARDISPNLKIADHHDARITRHRDAVDTHYAAQD